MIKSEKETYWRDRAERYSGFQWANDTGYLHAFIRACEFQPGDWVLDVGCGPGIVSHAIYPIVNRVIGMDSSREMLSQCDGLFNLMLGDVRDIPFPDETFDKVLARNVFHHVIEGLKDGMKECHRVLKPGGAIIIGERVPPSDSINIQVEYREMIALKDKRIVFTEDKLNWMITQVGFQYYTGFEYWIKGFNVREWLENSELEDDVQSEIWDRHVNGSQEFKDASEMRIKEGNCLIELKNLIMIGVKK